ncbi:MAG: methionyl-tRNA formyltransferase [Deltaproteobacteria bacterium]|nr:methionyl-tRNA formyltransferase [Deltaproteobacteria bacterium]
MNEFLPQNTPLVFMGTPEFSASVLRALIAAGFPLRAVVTRADAPTGRGQMLVASPVKAVAEEHGIAVITPQRLVTTTAEYLRELNAKLFVVVAYGKILKADILNIPPLGCINVHPSLLPQYRGPAPVNWALFNGEENSGISIMRMDEGIDTGDVVLQEVVPILPDDDYGSLLARYATLAGSMLIRAITLIATGKAHYLPQDDRQATYAPLITKELGQIDWALPVKRIANLVRGLSPNPAAYTFIDGRRWNVYVAGFQEINHGEPVGKIMPLTAAGLPIAAIDGFVLLREVQVANKKRLPVRDLLNGYKIVSNFVDGKP